MRIYDVTFILQQLYVLGLCNIRILMTILCNFANGPKLKML